MPVNEFIKGAAMLRTSEVVPISEARVCLTEQLEQAALVLLDEVETGLRQVLAGQRVSDSELSRALAG